MKRHLGGAVLGLLAAHGAYAGGVDRSGQSIAVLFEEGNYVELSYGSVSPSVSGVSVSPVLTPGASSGDMAQPYAQLAFSYKHRLSDALDVALIVDQPFGADTHYPATQPYFARGAFAELNSTAATGVVKYRFPSNLSLYAGLRYQTLDMAASVPFVDGWQGAGAQDGSVGYLAGVSYEIPEYFARVSLTYNSRITHDLATAESAATATGGLVVPSSTEITTPQSLNLEFRTGINPKTAIFGGVRWVEWSQFDITPVVYQGITGGSIVDYQDDRFTYTLGVARRLTDNWTALASLTYEAQTGSVTTNLSPTDGRTGISLGARYTKGNMIVQGGVNYTMVGSADTLVLGNPAAEFTDNDSLSWGIRVGYRF